MLAASLGVLLIGALTLDLALRGEREMDQSDRCFHRGDLVSAVAHARRAAVLYVPGAPHVDSAYARMVAIAFGSESMGKTDMARRAWAAVRAAALETRHLWVPHSRYLQLANHRLAVLEAAARTAPSSGPQRGDSAVESFPREHTPRWHWAVALVGGLLAAGAGLAALAVWGLDSEGRVRWRRAGWSLFLLAVGAACWTLAAVRA